MADKTGRTVAAPAGLATVDDSEGFRHTSSKVTAEQIMTDLKLEPAEEAEPVVETKVADTGAVVEDPLDKLDEDAIFEQAESRKIPRKAAIKHLVTRAKTSRGKYETEKQRADRLEQELATARAADRPAGTVTKTETTTDDGAFKRKVFDKVRPAFKEPDDPYDVEAVRAARAEHDKATDEWLAERDTFNAAQTAAETEHRVKAETAETAALHAAQRATSIIYERGKTRHKDYDTNLKAFVDAGGKWSQAINGFILQLGTADLDIAADVTAALVRPEYRAQVEKIAALPWHDAHAALSLFVARLPQPAAVKVPAPPAATAETNTAGPAADGQPTHAREAFQPGGASPESHVEGRDVSITAIPTTQFDVFMSRADEAEGRRRARP